MTEFQEKSTLTAVEPLAPSLYRLTLDAPRIAGAAHPGQFVMVRVGDRLDPLLRRPFSLHQVTATGKVQFLIKVVGPGTAYLANLQVGSILDLVGPLGRGFQLPQKESVCLIGGGVGSAPLFFLGKRLLLQDRQAENDWVLLGAQNHEELIPIADSFIDLGYPIKTATDDGSLGHEGFVTDLLDEVLGHVEKVYVCGPFPMMRIVAEKCMAAGVFCQVSLETHMACGLGACLGCTVNGPEGKYIHVCKQGPVFSAGEVSWIK